MMKYGKWLVCILLVATSAHAEKVVVIPLGKTVNINASINWTGEWGKNLPYREGDAVQYEGSSYLCIQTHESTDANFPPYQTYWGLIASKGDTGDQGIQGIEGQVGLKGATGDQGIQGIEGQVGLKGATGDQGIQGIEGQVGLKGATGDQGIQGEKGEAGDPSENMFKGDWDGSATYSRGDMIFYDNNPFWSLMDNNFNNSPNQGETTLCSDWSVAEQYNWIGLTGKPSSGTCVWSGATSDNLRSSAPFILYGYPNATTPLSNISGSTIITTYRTLTITSIGASFYCDGWVSGARIAFTLLVNGIPTSAYCDISVNTGTRSCSSEQVNIIVPAGSELGIQIASEQTISESVRSPEWSVRYTIP